MFDADSSGDEIDDLDSVEGSRPGSTRRSVSPTAIVPEENVEIVKESEITEEELELVEIKHTVARSDTVLSVARKYAADVRSLHLLAFKADYQPHELLSLNNLPPTALSSNPRILQTRKSIIISQRQIPKSQLSTLDSAPSIDPEEAKRRQEERAVKRFQLVTKTIDPGVGKAYLSLQGGSSDAHPLEMGSGEAMTGDGGSKKQGNLSKEDRAVEQWFEDDEWEGETENRLPKKKDGKWTSVGGVKQDEKKGWFGLKA
jgi:hypothetical protein